MDDRYEVRADSTTVDGWASRRLPFQPEAAMFHYLTELRAGIAKLGSPCPVLYGCYCSPDTSLCDVENVLLYNVGLSTFSHLGVTEVVVERFTGPSVPDRTDGQGPHHHHYRCGDVPQAAASRTVVTWPATPIEVPIRIERIWAALRRSGIVRSDAGIDARERPLHLRLDLHRPEGVATPSVLSAMKVLVDGAVASLHHHDGTEVDELSRRLAPQLGTGEREVVELLTDPTAAVLGVRRLLWPFRDFVQWNPADDGIVRIHVATVQADRWKVGGSLSVEP